MKKQLYLLLLLALLGACKESTSPQLLIRVIDGETIAPIKHAVVTIYDDHAKWLQHTDEAGIGLTNQFGEIQFNNLTSSVYYIEVNYTDQYQTTYTNYPLGVYATSPLKEGERAIVSVGVFDDDLFDPEDPEDQEDPEDPESQE